MSNFENDQFVGLTDFNQMKICKKKTGGAEDVIFASTDNSDSLEVFKVDGTSQNPSLWFSFSGQSEIHTLACDPQDEIVYLAHGTSVDSYSVEYPTTTLSAIGQFSIFDTPRLMKIFELANGELLATIIHISGTETLSLTTFFGTPDTGILTDSNTFNKFSSQTGVIDDLDVSPNTNYLLTLSSAAEIVYLGDLNIYWKFSKFHAEHRFQWGGWECWVYRLHK